MAEEGYEEVDVNERLTKIPGVPDKATAVDGMAHFAGPGPSGKRCKDCAFWRYYRKTGEKWDPEQNAVTYRRYRCSGCEMFWRLTGRHGPAISGENHSCKYFKPEEQK
jgi:hypothetical protein